MKGENYEFELVLLNIDLNLINGLALDSGIVCGVGYPWKIAFVSN